MILLAASALLGGCKKDDGIVKNVQDYTGILRRVIYHFKTDADTTFEYIQIDASTKDNKNIEKRFKIDPANGKYIVDIGATKFDANNLKVFNETDLSIDHSPTDYSTTFRCEKPQPIEYWNVETGRTAGDHQKLALDAKNLPKIAIEFDEVSKHLTEKEKRELIVKSSINLQMTKAAALN